MKDTTCPVVVDDIKCTNNRRSPNTECQGHYTQKKKYAKYSVLRSRIDRSSIYCPVHPDEKHVPERTYMVCKICQSITFYSKRYNITPEDYKNILIKQNYKCGFANCSISFFDSDIRSGNIKSTHRVQSLYIDHDHKNNKVRGLLCRNHNFLLGHANDSISILKDAIDYLKDFNGNTVC